MGSEPLDRLAPVLAGMHAAPWTVEGESIYGGHPYERQLVQASAAHGDDLAGIALLRNVAAALVDVVRAGDALAAVDGCTDEWIRARQALDAALAAVPDERR